MLKLRRSYTPSKWKLAVFRVAFYVVGMTLLLILIVFLYSLSNPNQQFEFPVTPLISAVFWITFAAVGSMILAGFYLWFGMLHFLFMYDGSRWKVLWFPIVLFGLSYGAALYYMTTYTKLVSSRSADIDHIQ